MIYIPNITIKRLKDLVPGDIFEFNLRSCRAFGLLLGREKESFAVAVLAGDEEALVYPFALDLTDRTCASYGSDWVMELLPSKESVVGNQNYFLKSGVVYLTSNGPTIYFPWHSGAGRPHYSEGISFALNTAEIAEDPSEFIPYLGWKIWFSLDHRDECPDKPLIAYTTKQDDNN